MCDFELSPRSCGLCVNDTETLSFVALANSDLETYRSGIRSRGKCASVSMSWVSDNRARPPPVKGFPRRTVWAVGSWTGRPSRKLVPWPIQESLDVSRTFREGVDRSISVLSSVSQLRILYLASALT
jgi:hypothetical protein